MEERILEVLAQNGALALFLSFLLYERYTLELRAITQVEKLIEALDRIITVMERNNRT